MTTMNRVSVAWQNWPGAPGVTQLYVTGAITQPSVDSIRSFFQALVSLIPSGLTIQVPSSGDQIDDVTGRITGAWSVASTPAVVTGTASGNYAGNAGAVIHWLTTVVVNNRRLRGRTFIVPLSGGATYDTGGSLAPATITTLTTAANGLVTALGVTLAIWHRPTNFSGGSSAAVTSVRVPDLAVSLRSRRI